MAWNPVLTASAACDVLGLRTGRAGANAHTAWPSAKREARHCQCWGGGTGRPGREEEAKLVLGVVPELIPVRAVLPAGEGGEWEKSPSVSHEQGAG